MKRKYLIKFGYTNYLGLFENSVEIVASSLDKVFEEMGFICYSYMQLDGNVFNYINYELVEE